VPRTRGVQRTMGENTTTMDDRLAGPFEPDTLLPIQFFGALRRKTQIDGERRLMIAVLEDAVHCYMKHARATDPRTRQLFSDAEEWIMASDRSWFFSFENVCDTLDLNPDYVREGLLKWKATQHEVAPAADCASAEAAADEDAEVELRTASGGA
jgi:hypothetical protein